MPVTVHVPAFSEVYTLAAQVPPAPASMEKTVVLLTGIGGVGKSTLATRLANRCKQDGYRVVALQARRAEAGLFCLRLLDELAAACQRLGREGDERMLRDGRRPIAERLRLAVEVLKLAANEKSEFSSDFRVSLEALNLVPVRQHQFIEVNDNLLLIRVVGENFKDSLLQCFRAGEFQTLPMLCTLDCKAVVFIAHDCSPCPFEVPAFCFRVPKVCIQ